MQSPLDRPRIMSDDLDWEVTSGDAPRIGAPPPMPTSPPLSVSPILEDSAPCTPSVPSPSAVDQDQPLVGRVRDDDVGGDVRFLCSDGIIVTAHSMILERASLRFREPMSWHKQHGGPILVEHHSMAVNTIVQLLYPNDQRPSIASRAELISVLEAAKTLQITSFTVRETLNDLLEAEPHPLRAWALATVFGYPNAQKHAIERYLETYSSFLDDIPEEMRLVDAYQILQLNAAKERALKAARLSLSQVPWVCQECESVIVQPPASPVREPCRKHSDPIPGCSKHRPGRSLDCLMCRKVIKKRSCTCFPDELDEVDQPIEESDREPAVHTNEVIPKAPDNWPPAFQPFPIHSDTATNAVPNLSPPPAWHHEFTARTEKMNPFAIGTTSNTVLELCFLLHPPTCGHGVASSHPHGGAQNVRVALRKGLDDIISREMESLGIVSVFTRLLN